MRDGGLLGAPLARYEDSDALDHLSRRRGSLGQEGVGAVGTVEGVHRAGDDHGRQPGTQMFGAADQLVAVHLWHQQVAEQEIDSAGNRLLQDLKCIVRSRGGDDVVAACIQEEERATEEESVRYRRRKGSFFSGAKCSRFCRTPPYGWARGRWAKAARCWLAVRCP